MCTLHAITHRKCSKGPYLIFLFSFFIKCQWVMPDVSLTGEDVNPNAARVLAQTRRKAPVWPSAKRSCFSFSNCSLMCQKKEKKKEKKEKKSVYALQRERRSRFFFFFFGSVDPAEVAAYVTGTVSVETHEKVRKHEQEGRKRRIRGKKNMKRA